MFKIRDHFTITLNNVDITDYVVRFTRTASICSGEETIDIVVDNVDVNVWDKIELYENEEKIKTYNVDSISISTPNGTKVIHATDIKRIRDYFIPESYVVTYPSTVRYWIEKFASEAGVNVTFLTSSVGNYVSKNTSMGLTSFYTQLQTLLQIAGWYSYIDENGNLIIDELFADRHPQFIFTDNVIKLSEKIDDKFLRNRAVVWGSTDVDKKESVFADVKVMTPWNIVDKTVVVANSDIPNVGSAYYIANTLISEFNSLTNVLTVSAPAITGATLGDTIYVNVDRIRRIDFITSYTKSVVDNQGAIENITVGERCPRLFAYWGWDTDWVYVATDKGIFRKPMITQSGQQFEWQEFNYGISEDDRITTKVAVHNGLLGAVTSGGNAYYADIIYEYWHKIPISGSAVDIGVEPKNIYVGHNIEISGMVSRLSPSTSPFIVFSGSEVYSVDSLDVTGFTTISGDTGEVVNQYSSTLTGRESEGVVFGKTPYKSPSNLLMNIYDVSSVAEFESPGAFAVSGDTFEISHTDSYVFYYDRVNNQGLTVENIDTSSYKYLFNLLHNEKLYLTSISKSTAEIELELIRLNDFGKSTITIDNDTNKRIYTARSVIAGDDFGLLYIKYDNSSGEVRLFTYDGLIGSNKLLLTLDGNNWGVNIVPYQCVYYDRFVFLLSVTDYSTNSTQYYVVTDSGELIEVDVQFTEGIDGGMDKVNSRCYYRDIDGNGLIFNMSSVEIESSGLIFQSDTNTGFFFYSEDGDDLYYIVVEDNQLKIIYDVSHDLYYNPVDAYIPLGIDHKYVIQFDSSTNSIILSDTGNNSHEVLFTLGHEVVNNGIDGGAEIYISGGVVWYTSTDGKYYTAYSGDGTLRGSQKTELFRVFDDEVDKVNEFYSKYKVSLGKSSIYLYTDYPNAVYIADTYKDKYTSILNGNNFVYFPRETVFGSGSTRDVLAIDNDIITKVSVSGIINNEYNVAATPFIPVTSGAVLEVSNNLYPKNSKYPKMLYSNGIDKIYENCCSGKFTDVTANLLDFGVQKIFWIAIDDDI